MQRILYIGHVWPEPRSSAAGQRTLSLLRVFFEAGWHVTFASAAEASERCEGLAGAAHQTTPIVLNDDGFDGFVVTLRPDVVVFDRFMTEEQFGWRVEDHAPAALRILDTIDLHCLRSARRTGSADEESVRQTLLASELSKREVAAILRCDLSLIISRFEVELLQELFGVDSELLLYLPFLIERDSQKVADIPFAKRTGFATIGNFLHAPNADSVEWMRAEIWPLIRRRLPSAELNVYGAYTPERILALDDPRSGFRVRGWADDARRVLGESRVCLAPLRFGAGLKGKIADAMASGTPVVTTTIGAEGMGSSKNTLPDAAWCGAIADDANAIADAAAELHQNPDKWEVSRQRGFELLNSEFDAELLATALLDRTVDCLDHLKARRLRNFAGAMLRHHHHRSTKFLSRWIQAKNRPSQ